MMTAKKRPIILYLATHPHQCFQVECVYDMFRKLTKQPIRKYLEFMVRMHSLPTLVTSRELKQVLNIRKHLPLVIDHSTIFFPLSHKRSVFQYFINGMQIAGVKQECKHTRIIFTNGKHLVVEASLQFIQRKWLECIFLHHYIFTERG